MDKIDMTREGEIKKWLIIGLTLISALLLWIGVNGSKKRVATPGAHSGEQTLRMAIASEPPTLDWSLATDNVSIRIIENLMEGLTTYDKDLNPIPAVAEHWKVSPDGRRYTFSLRKDVSWSDGRSVTAHDFEYAWKRLLNPKTAAEYAYFLFDVVNAAEYNAGKVTDPDQVGVRALDATRLQVDLKQPIVFFPSITTFTATFPLRQDVVERYGDHWTDPGYLVSNGPFRLKEWKHEYKVILEANDRYYAGRPSLDQVIFYVVGDSSTALTLYETEGLELVRLPPVAIPYYQKSPEYLNFPFLRGYYYGFNVTQRPFDNPKIRRAFSMAIDRSEFPKILKGGEIPTSSWIPKGMPGYNPNIGLPFDPERARRVLAEAGFPDGKGFPKVTAVFNTDPENNLIAENLQAQWKKNLGVKVELDNQEWKVYLKRLKTDTPGLFRLGWGADYPDPDNFMNLFTSTSGNNNTHWQNKRYDDLIRRAAVERDSQHRQALYDEAQRILIEEEVPIMPLFIAAQNMLIKPYLKGLQINAMDLLYLKTVSIDVNSLTSPPGRQAGLFSSTAGRDKKERGE
jgi:oligopeptide transport system substrate-binding protein